MSEITQNPKEVLVSRIFDAMTAKNTTFVKAAEMLNTTPENVKFMLGGNFEQFSEAQLEAFLEDVLYE